MAPVETWTPKQVQDWLSRLGFAQLIDAFAKHEIDGEVLLSLNEDDLSRPPFNMKIFGHMRKLSLALARLKEANLAGEFFDENQDDVVVEPEESSNDAAAEPMTTSIEASTVCTLTHVKSGLIDEIVQTDDDDARQIVQQQIHELAVFDFSQQQQANATSDQCPLLIQMDEQVTVNRVIQNADDVIIEQIIAEDNFTNEFSQNLIMQRNKQLPSGASGSSPFVPAEPTMTTDQAGQNELLYPYACWRYPTSQDQLLSAVNFDPAKTAEDKPKNCGFKAEVSYFVSPVEIYVQPDYLQDSIDNLVDEMTEFYEKNDKMQPILFDDFFEGMPCAVKFREDGRWYRAKVAEKGGEDCRVIFIDWGNSQFERYADIRPLLTKFGLYPPLTFRCRIAGVRERTLVQKVVDNFKYDIETVLDKIVYCIPRRFENGVLIISLINMANDEDLGKKYLPTEAICPICPKFLPSSSGYGDDSGVGGENDPEDNNAMRLSSSGGDFGDSSQQLSFNAKPADAEPNADADVQILSDDDDDEEQYDEDMLLPPPAVILAPVLVPQPYPRAPVVPQPPNPQHVPQTIQVPSIPQSVPQTSQVSQLSNPQPQTSRTQILATQPCFTVIVRPCSTERMFAEQQPPAEPVRPVPLRSTLPAAASASTVSSAEFRPLSADQPPVPRKPSVSAFHAADSASLLGAFDRALVASQLRSEISRQYTEKMEKLDSTSYKTDLQAFLDGIPVFDEEIDTDTDEDVPAKQKGKAGFKQTRRKMEAVKKGAYKAEPRK